MGDQLKRNRESSFPQSKDVKLDIKDWHVTMLGRDGAVVSCLWTQTQTFNGQPDSGSGRMTLVFKNASERNGKLCICTRRRTNLIVARARIGTVAATGQ